MITARSRTGGCTVFCALSVATLFPRGLPASITPSQSVACRPVHTRLCTVHCLLCTSSFRPAGRGEAHRVDPPGQQLHLEGVPVEPQEPGRLRLVPSHPLEDAKDHLTIEPLPRFPQRETRRAVDQMTNVRQHMLER